MTSFICTGRGREERREGKEVERERERDGEREIGRGRQISKCTVI